MEQNKNRNGNDLIKLLVIIFDFVTINALMLAFVKLAPDFVPPFFHKSSKLAFFILNVAMVISQFMYSTIIHFRKVKLLSVFIQVFKLSIVCCGIFFFSIKLLAYEGGVYNFMLVFSPIVFLTLFLTRIAEKYVLQLYRKAGGNTASVIFVGNDPANAMLYNSMMKDYATGYRVIGYFADDVMQGVDSNFKHLGTISDLHSMMRSCLAVSDNDKKVLSEKLSNEAQECNKDFTLSGVGEIFCCLSHSRHDDISAIMEFCDKNVIHFYYVPRQFGDFQLSLKPETVGEFNLYTNHTEPLANVTNYAEKRIFDIVFSGIVCLCLLPFIPIIALIIIIQSPGPLFFKQSRTGLNGENFKCWKFRSMHVNKDADTKQATKNDPRKFSFGNFMRKTNIDELPQFFNVLMGDMSIVGPRPHMLKHTEEYSKIIDKYMVRHFCKPGITGYAQVTGFRGETKEVWQMEERIKRDIWYIENWSFALDLKIIFLTAKSIIVPDKNAY